MELGENKNIRIIYLVSSLIISLVLLVSYGVYRFSFSSVNVYSEKGAEQGVLNPLNGSAKKAFVKNNKTAFFSFTESQKNLLLKTFDGADSVAVVFCISVKFPSGRALADYEKMDSLPMEIGFLDKSDFNKKGKLDFKIQNHNLVSCNLKNVIDYEKTVKVYEISFALPVDKTLKKLELKEGIFIKSIVPLWLQYVSVKPAVTGFDLSGEIDFWGFSSNGGVLDFKTDSFDFTGSSNIFPSGYSSVSVPPDLTLKMAQSDEEKADFSFSFGGEKLKIKRLETIRISSLGLKNPFSNMVIKDNVENVQAVLMHKGDESILNQSSEYVVTPIKVDPGLILSWPKENWRCRDYELFEWDRIPHILFFDTKNYSVQSKFFARIAFFIEKEGFKGKLLTNEELKGKHDYNAHDYSAESLAKFFNKAFRLNFRLNPEEELLLEILVRNNLLERVDDSINPYVSKGGAVLSVSREIPSWNRGPLLAHEGWHTIYFTDEEFRNYVSVVYNVLDEKSMGFLVDYFKSQPSLGYDTNDSYLMQNEFMAYILQNNHGQAGSYFVTKAGWPSVKKFTPELSEYIIQTGGSGFDDCQNMLEDFLFSKYNLKSGNIGLCSY